MTINKLTGREEFFCYTLLIAPPILGFFSFPAKYAIVSLYFLFVYVNYISDWRFRKISFSFPLNIWLALTIFHVINAYIKNVPGVDAIDMLHGLKIYSCIVIFTYWACLDLKKTVRLLTGAFIARCILVLFLLLLFPHAHENSGRLTGAGTSATGLGQMAAITGIFIVYLNAIYKKSILYNLRLFFFPLVVVLLTQSRNSLAMILVSFIVLFLVRGRTKKGFFSVDLILSFILLFIGLFVAFQFFSGSDFAQRFDTSYEEDSYFYQNYSTGTLFDTIVGDRIFYYIKGWEFFLESPMTGIGMWNFKNLTGGDYPLHSEYMVHLCEGGLVAAALWLTFIFYVIKVIINDAPNIYIKLAASSSIAVLLFCGIYAREFFYEIFYPAYGLILSLHFKKELNTNLQNDLSKNQTII